ncbi:hypothetical protein E2C01_028751 [Portunus trituberculatus]|uniref:Uncharacterized protein n=1 Tax=Portunus trituberculatus TaxID=210409 RepID=A0A5B7EQB1_PORTR|nr:hypothetical protein [Portunus trituberculatus]
MVVTTKPDPCEINLWGVCPHGRILKSVVDLIGQNRHRVDMVLASKKGVPRRTQGRPGTEESQ